jgi:hypothetical protein
MRHRRSRHRSIRRHSTHHRRRSHLSKRSSRRSYFSLPWWYRLMIKSYAYLTVEQNQHLAVLKARAILSNNKHRH